MHLTEVRTDELGGLDSSGRVFSGSPRGEVRHDEVTASCFTGSSPVPIRIHLRAGAGRHGVQRDGRHKW